MFCHSSAQALNVEGENHKEEAVCVVFANVDVDVQCHSCLNLVVLCTGTCNAKGFGKYESCHMD